MHRYIARVIALLFILYLSADAGITPPEQQVSIQEKIISAKPGNQIIKFSLQIASATDTIQPFTCQWVLSKYQTPVLQGEIRVKLASSKNTTLEIPVKIPEDIRDNNYILEMRFYGESGQNLGNHTLWLKPPNWEQDFILRLRNQTFDKNWKIVADSQHVQFDHEDFSFDILSATATWFMISKEQNTRLITKGPFIRYKANAIEDASVWHLQTKARKVEKEEKDYQFLTFYSIEKNKPELSCEIDSLVSAYGFIDFRCNLPKEWIKMETGISFIIPSTLTDIRVFGTGPSQNIKKNEGEMGIHAFSSLDIQQPAYYQHTSLITILNDQFNGLGIMLLEGTVLFEKQKEDLCVTLFPNQKKENQIVFRLLPVSEDNPEILFKNFFPVNTSAAGKELN